MIPAPTNVTDSLALPSSILKLGEFAFIDVETTGGSAIRDRVTEVAIIRFHADGSVERWQSLINPGMSIPAAIQALTGITNAMVRDAPTFFDVREDVRRMLEGAVFVAHNARFDYGFIKNEFRRQSESFTADVLCTVRLSRALYPNADGHGLDAVIHRHKLRVTERHRAMGDTEATAAFVVAATAEHGDEHVHAAVKSLLRMPSLPQNLPTNALHDIPDSAGVYLFFGINDLPLYVGKAKHLRERIRSHFSSDHMSSNDLRLSQELRRIEWIPTAGEFSALLLEAQIVKQRLPLHNVKLRRREKLGFFQLVETDENTSLEWIEVSAVETITADLFGPYSDKAAAKRSLMETAREHRLCDHALGFSKPRVKDEPCFARQIGRCHGVCIGLETAQQHGERIRAALSALAVPVWPFPGEAVYEERDEANDRTDLLVFDQWCAVVGGERMPFDADVYKLLRQTMGKTASKFRALK